MAWPRKTRSYRLLEDRIPTGIQLYRAHAGYRLAMNRALEPVGVTVPQFSAMARLQATPGLSNAELARRNDVTPQTMNVILGRLEAAGLVVRRPHPEHGLILQAELTPAGHEVVEQCLAEAESVEASALQVLDVNERRLLLELLSRVSDCLADEST